MRFEIFGRFARELKSTQVSLGELLNTTVEFKPSAAVNRKILYATHSTTSYDRVLRLLQLDEDELSRVSSNEPITCWLVDEKKKGGDIRRYVAIRDGHHRIALRYYETLINPIVTGIAYMENNQVVNYEGNFEPSSYFSPYGIFHKRAMELKKTVLGV